jgi:hypothetical protein
VFSVQGVLTERQQSQPVHWQFKCRHITMCMQFRILWQRNILLPLFLCICSTNVCHLCSWQYSQRPHVCLQRRILRQRAGMLALQDLLCRQLSISDTMPSRKHCRHSCLLLQRWVLRRWHNVFSMQGVLTERHESQTVPRQH